jgi:16S rRNA (adenine1518-N6/adenine1519-N6)-dimethyltransferase
MSIKAKKSLGQHFLRSKVALARMVKAGDLGPGELVLEIGPGQGALTKELLDAGATVIAVEADERCIFALRDRFDEAIAEGSLRVLHGDMRDAALRRRLFDEDLLGDREYKLIANIPYYLTGMLLREFLENLRRPSRIVYLVQREVAESATAKGGKESVLSLSIKIFGDPRYVALVKKDAFTPPPKVDSAILAIENIGDGRLSGLDPKDFFAVVRAGMGSRRKMLLGSLSRAFPNKKDAIGSAFSEERIPSNARGEDVPLSQWVALARTISER